jgi:hypothetical protein
VADQPNTDFANTLQHKVDMYFIGLVFTVMALAIQSAKFSGHVLQWLPEVSGWLCLIAAGVLGLWRMQQIPRIFHYGEHAGVQRSTLGKITDPAAMEQARADITVAQMMSDTINRAVGRSGTAQLRLFGAGLILIAVARAYAGYVAACA